MENTEEKIGAISFIAYGILFLVLLTLVVPSVFAQNVYPGECQEVVFPNADPVNFTLVSNTSTIDDFFSWSKNETVITYCFTSDSPTGNFTFKWWNSEEVEVSSSQSSSSGGGKVIPRAIPKVEVSQGIEKILSPRQNFYFEVVNRHKFTLLTLEPSIQRVVILVESKSTKFDLGVGETYSVCLDDQLVDIKLVEIMSQTYAKISMLNTKQPCEVPSEPSDNPPVIDYPPQRDEFFYVIAIIVVILFVFFLVFKKRRMERKI